MLWVNAQLAYLLVVWWATSTVEDDKVAIGVSDPVEYDEVVTTKGTKMIDAFSSHIIHAKVGSACTDTRLNVMTLALCPEDGSLPQGLTIQNAYTEMCNSSKNVSVVVKNSTAYPQTLKKKIPVVRVVSANWLELQIWPRMIEVLDEAQGIWMPKLTPKQRQEKLFKKLDLSRLESWPPELADSAQSLLAEYHDIFSLESSELDCTEAQREDPLIEHSVGLAMKVPFKQTDLMVDSHRSCLQWRRQTDPYRIDKRFCDSSGCFVPKLNAQK